jgi:cation:H+ antiporter
MVLIPLVLICVGLAIVVFSADEAIKRLLNLARFFRLSEFITSFVIAGIIAILPELSIGVIAALEESPSLGLELF